MDPALPLQITLPPRGSRTRLRTLHQQLRSAILDGRLQPGLRLPATRVLADAYGVSRNTAVAAYDLLMSEGYLVARPRLGAYVADTLPRARHRNRSEAPFMSDRRLNAFWREPRLLVPQLAATRSSSPSLSRSADTKRFHQPDKELGKYFSVASVNFPSLFSKQ